MHCLPNRDKGKSNGSGEVGHVFRGDHKSLDLESWKEASCLDTSLTYHKRIIAKSLRVSRLNISGWKTLFEVEYDKMRQVCHELTTPETILFLHRIVD